MGEGGRAKVCGPARKGAEPRFIEVQSWAAMDKVLQGQPHPRLIGEEGAEGGWLFTFSFFSQPHQDET